MSVNYLGTYMWKPIQKLINNIIAVVSPHTQTDNTHRERDRERPSQGSQN